MQLIQSSLKLFFIFVKLFAKNIFKEINQLIIQFLINYTLFILSIIHVKLIVKLTT